MLIYIKPLSTFPKLHSDTLFGAITSAINELYPDMIEDMIKEYCDGRPPFIRSSAFPYIYNDERKVRFYPKILLDQDHEQIDDPGPSNNISKQGIGNKWLKKIRKHIGMCCT